MKTLQQFFFGSSGRRELSKYIRLKTLNAKLNFCPASRFNMHHGKLINGTVYAQLSPSVRTACLVSPVKNGQYLVFTIPPGQANEQIKNYTTLFRENLIGNKRIFRPEDFFIFLLLSEDESQIGEFYMYLSGSG